MAAYVFWFALQLTMFGGGRMCVLRSRLKLYVMLPTELEHEESALKPPLFHVTSIDRHDQRDNISAIIDSISNGSATTGIIASNVDGSGSNAIDAFTVGSMSAGSSRRTARLSSDLDEFGSVNGSLGDANSQQPPAAHSFALLAPMPITMHASTTSALSSRDVHDRQSIDVGRWKIFSFVKSASDAEAHDHYTADMELPDAPAPQLRSASVRVSALQPNTGQRISVNTDRDKSNESASWSLFDNTAVDDNWFVAAMSVNAKATGVEGVDSTLLSPPSASVPSLPSSSSSFSLSTAPLDPAVSSLQSSSASFLAADTVHARTEDTLQPGNMELRPVLPEGFDGEFEYRPLLASAWLVNRYVSLCCLCSSMSCTQSYHRMRAYMSISSLYAWFLLARSYIVSEAIFRIVVRRMLSISPLIVGIYGSCLFTLAIALFLGAPRNWLEFSLLLPLLVVSAVPIIALPDRRLLGRLLRSFEYLLLVFSVVSVCVAFAVQDAAELAVKCQNRTFVLVAATISFHSLLH